MLQDFITEINWEIPKISKKRIYRIFCSLKWRVKKYSKFGIGKRDGIKFGISERQMTYFINLMTDYWFLEVSGETRGGRGFMCRLFTASEQLKEFFLQIKDVIITKVTNLTDRIAQWNKNTDWIQYLSTMVIIKRKYWENKFKYNWVKYVIPRWNKYIYNTQDQIWMNLFDFMDSIWDKNIIKTALQLNIIG